MRALLSIRTVVPWSGARIWYDDQREANRQISPSLGRTRTRPPASMNYTVYNPALIVYLLNNQDVEQELPLVQAAADFLRGFGLAIKVERPKAKIAGTQVDAMLRQTERYSRHALSDRDETGAWKSDRCATHPAKSTRAWTSS